MKNILAFETSCDETAVALLRFTKNSRFNNFQYYHSLHSQTDIHSQFGGVVPELASRDHIRKIKPLAQNVLQQANLNWNDIDYFAYTAGPGLAGALMVAGGFTQALATSIQKPVIPIHHLEGHLLSPLLAKSPPQFPYIALLISGGHSQIYKVIKPKKYELLGESVDDAAGEAFDKSAKLLGLTYPGGQHLEKLAAKYSKPKASKKLPRPMINSKNLNMSFSGLKTAVWHWVSKSKIEDYPEIAFEFQNAITEVLISKALSAINKSGINNLAVCGGVARNRFLFNAFMKQAKNKKVNLFFTPFEYCTDNAVMIALAASFYLEQAKKSDGSFKICPHWQLSS